MLERFTSFNDYVREYGLERSEGVLLRYLSQAYKALAQTVPESYRTEEIEDVLAALRTTIRGVDSSLLDEWEQRKSGSASVRAGESVPGGPPPPVDPTADPKAFAARVRNDLHRLLKALADKSWEDAAVAVHPAWDPKAIEAAMAPWFVEHSRIDVTPAARRPQWTTLKKTGPRVWEAVQRIVGTNPPAGNEAPEEDPEGEADWILECTVDFTEPRVEDVPWIDLRRIGT